jgi:AcrR family transcriptional regulator
MVSMEAPSEEDTRRRILEQARDRFLAEGFVNVSVDDLCNDLGISKKTFYRFFPSKDELLRQDALWLMGQARAFIEGLLKSDRGFAEKVRTFSTEVAIHASRVSRTLIRDVQRHAPDIWKQIEEFRLKALQSNFTALVEQGIAEGYIRSDINTRVFLLAYVAAINQIMTPAVLAVEPFSPSEAIRNIFDIFFHGVLTDRGKSVFSPMEHSSSY